MLVHDAFVAAAELKFVENEPEGTLEGYGSIFGNVDSHGDVITPGAFTATLAEHKARGTMPRMYLEHSAYMFGGDPLPIGVWKEMRETDQGLYCKGRLVGMTSPHIQRIRDMMLEDGLKGLSIGFSPAKDGAVIGQKSGEPKRTLKKINLLSVDLVGDPSNPLARVSSVKSVTGLIDPETAVKSLANAMRLHRASLAGGNSPNADQRAEIFGHLTNAHKALTGLDMPPDMKHSPETIDEFRKALQDTFGWSRTKASAVAGQGFKSESSDEDERKATEAKAALKAVSAVLDGFSLTRP